MTIQNSKKIYMIGIKGVGMTMLAQYLSQQGKTVIGSDNPETFMTDQILVRSGIEVFSSFNTDNIPADADMVIYSTAYSADNNVEVAVALNSKTPVVTYAQALGEIFNNKYGIAVAGSHGKTTTTAWLGFVLDRGGKSPSVLVGANVPQFNGASLIGRSDYMVVEADEYQNKLKFFDPKIILLNNIDYDHPDFFANAENYTGVFVDFIKKIPRNGFLIANYDDSIIKKIANVNTRGQVITYAINESADYVAYDIKTVGGKQYFKVKSGVNESDGDDELSSSELGDFCINLLGKHNVYNALAVIAAAIELRLDLAIIRTHLEEFTGTARRMQVLGEYRGATIIDDYAHHPTEIRATLEAVQARYPAKNIVTIFHPHTFSRTLSLLDQFINSFHHTDTLVVLDIYGSAREKHGGIHSRDIVDKINKLDIDLRPRSVIYIPDLKTCEQWLRDNITRDDIVVLMGAGDVFRIGENLLKD